MTDKSARSERLDHYVARQLSEKSRSFGTKLIGRGKVLVNGQAQPKAAYKLHPADKVKILYNASDAERVPQIELPVLYEDDDCVVINKPTGILSHSKGAFNPEATVASWLSGRVKNLNGERAGIVHRLDRPTSGVMICAKTPEAMSWLQKQFSTRKVKKTYLAVVSGTPKNLEAVIDMPIERNPRKLQTFRVGSNGKPAQTAYRVIQTGSRLSLLELQPTTGRTHQLRVHLKKLGHPILGDTLYGGQASERLFLHAKSLELTLPNRQRALFEAPLPPGFKEVLGK